MGILSCNGRMCIIVTRGMEWVPIGPTTQRSPLLDALVDEEIIDKHDKLYVIDQLGS